MNRGGQPLTVDVSGQTQQAPVVTTPDPGRLPRKFKSLGSFCLRIRERIGRWTDALLALVAAVALAIGYIYPYRGVIVAVIGVAFVIVIVIASAMLTVQSDQHMASIDRMKSDFRNERSRAEDAIERLSAVESGRAIDGQIAEQLHRVHHHLRFCSWSLTEGGGKDFGERIGWVVHHIAQLFKEMVDETCRACIKEIIPSNALGMSGSTFPITTVVYRTLRRTQDTHPPRTDRVPQPLVKSYCFRQLWLHSSTTKWILINDIEREYEENPEFLITSRPKGTPDPRYNSTIVWPIQIDLRQIDAQSAPVDQPIIFGFLAVDSLAKKFTEDHAWIGAGIADACFATLASRRQ